jgi:hypothetical protein
MVPFPQKYPGPLSTIGRFDVQHAMFNGAPQEITLSDRPEDKDGRPELAIGGPTFIFPLRYFGKLPTDVIVELQHFATASVDALNKAGAVLTTATAPSPRKRLFLQLKGKGIQQLRFKGAEILLYRICWR